ncbi:MAG: hypothetical protein IKG21_03065 [Atopobiaceae bacterium]|nr:hypothetical protein [Atopobiaceae bacterium]
MRHRVVDRIIACTLSAVMALSVCMPAPALALLANVEVENHSQGNGGSTVSGLVIDGVSAPAAGQELDGDAVVTSAEGATWDIPVLWVSDDLQLATQAEEGRSYLPALAFYVPEGCELEGDAYAVRLSDSLTELFGGQEIVSVYNAATGVTYILPASIRDFFAASRGNESAAANAGHNTADATAVQGNGIQDGVAPAGTVPAEQRSLVEIYCAQTARDALSDEDLEWLLNLIINTLEPQAVEYLLNSFPAFRTGAENGEIGTQIGLYVYWYTGDKDGIKEHEDASRDALAYVAANAVKTGDAYKYCYMIGVNVDDLLARFPGSDPLRDESTGKFMLMRNGDKVLELENTIVHELFHALMDDYNRTGMAGVTNTNDYVLDSEGMLLSEEITQRYAKMHFPTWFIEGSATAVEHNYQFYKEFFDGLRMGENDEIQNYFTVSTLVECYLNGKVDSKNAYFDLVNCDGGVDNNGQEIRNTASAYVCGNLAVKYLADLASVKNTGYSSLIFENGTLENVDTNRLRMGLNSILERMHKGETLDQVIADISPVDASGAKIYKDTDDFANKFIKGPILERLPNDQATYSTNGDENSTVFVCMYLNYLNYVSNLPGRENNANGSILLPVDIDVNSPLDPTKNTQSDYLKIVASNREVPSTVPDSVAYAGGGKSDPEAAVAAASDEPVASATAAKDAAAKGAATRTAGTKESAAKEAGTKEAAAKETTTQAAAVQKTDTAKRDETKSAAQPTTTAENATQAPANTSGQGEKEADSATTDAEGQQQVPGDDNQQDQQMTTEEQVDDGMQADAGVQNSGEAIDLGSGFEDSTQTEPVADASCEPVDESV